jgi:hypothetical protein
MLVNNSAQQPDCSGHILLRSDGSQGRLCVKSDSVAYDFCQSLGCNIAEAPLFDDVRICDDTMRYDSLFSFSTHFLLSEVPELCDKYNVDAIISLDRFVCNTVYEEPRLGSLLQGDNVRVVIQMELRALWKGQESAISIELSDTLQWNYEFDYYMLAEHRRNREKNIKRALHYLADYMGQNSKVNFIPWWNNETRWYYSGNASTWKNASSLTAAERWNEALTAWNSILAATDKWQLRARLTSNIALCNEMCGNIDKALEAATETYRLFNSNLGKDDNLTQLQKKYIEMLEARIAKETALTNQLREN